MIASYGLNYKPLRGKLDFRMPINTPRLTQGHRTFLKHYTGRDPSLAWNATRSYMAAYKLSSERSASVGGSRLLQNPLIKVIIAKAHARLDEKIVTDSSFVLEQSRRLYDRAMGDEPVPGDAVITKDPETGEESVHVPEVRQYDPATARQALQLIGQHKAVQAFTVTVEHSHTHVLEQRLAARSKVIEGLAGQVDADPILAGDTSHLKSDKIALSAFSDSESVATPSAQGQGDQVFADPRGQCLGDEIPALAYLSDDGAHAADTGDARAPVDLSQAADHEVGPAAGGHRDPDPAHRGNARESAEATAK